MKAIVLLLIVILSFSAYAQDVTITQVELQSNGDVLVHYNLQDERLDRKYSLYLYSSADNYIQPLENVTGDVGVDISVGGNKTLVWHAKEELGESFKGGVALELKGSIYVPFIALDGFDDYKVFKRGKPYDVTWTGGRGDNVLNFELYRDDDKVKVLEERPNVGNTTIIIPSDVKPGRYKFKISDSRNKDEVVYTLDFRVKRKVPLGLKLGLMAVVAGGVGYLAGSSDSAEAKIGEPPLPSN
ncbi:MAG: hypothetical protein KDC93_17555 [Cyclobacteriaceae bacterium]|nr:hypothetical protein [Cyclobacteriaceae bacterium]